MMMRKAAKLITTITLLTMAGIWLFGCGSSDLLDENEQRYQVSMELEECDEETLDIDTIRDFDCNDDGNLTDPECFTNVFASITVTVPTNAAGITLHSYRVEYIPLETPVLAGGTVLPPELVEPQDGEFTYPIQAGASATFRLTWLNFNTKAEFSTWFTATGVFGRYQMRITLYFEDEFGEEREISASRTVWLGNYDKC